ncbi:MAG: DUF4349 domain-containing protein [Chthonomonas sp.]|nr:DUF4349 domain-containing protein [Chthonomonas sp.]
MKSSKLALLPLLIALSLAGCSPSRVDRSGGYAAEAPAVEMEAKAASLSTTVTQRQIIRRGELMLKVKDLREAQSQAVRYVNQVGGFVEAEQSSNLTLSVSETALTLRVPVAKFESAMETFSGLGTPLSRSVSSEDITSQVVDMEARLRVMRAQEEVYLNLLKQSRSLKDSLEVQNRLMELRQEIESIDAQLKSQRELASLSTIVLTLRTDVKPVPEDQNEGWAQESWTAATNSLGSVARQMGAQLIGFIVFAPIWLPFAILVWWLVRRNKKPSPPPVS